MLRIILKLAPEAVWVLVKVNYGISEGHWTKLGLKSTLVVVLLLVLVLQNVKDYPETGFRSCLGACQSALWNL